MSDSYKHKIIILVAVLVGFLILSLPSNKTNTKNDIKPIKFEDLPDDEKQKYINKDELSGYTIHSSINFDKNLSNDIDVLQSIVKDFAIKNEILIKDNININEKNLAISLELDNLKSRLETQQNDLKFENDNLLKAKEEQHYENIKELTEKLKESQTQNLESIKNYEQKITKLQNQLDDINSNHDKNISALIIQKDNEIRMLILDNEKLKNRLNNKFIDENTTKNINNINQRELKNSQNELLSAKKEIDNIKFMHSKELERLNNGYNIQKIALEDELSKKSNQILDLQAEIKAKSDELTKIKKDMQTLKNENELNANKIKIIEQNATELNLNLKKTMSEFKIKNDENLKIKTAIEAKNIQIKNIENNLTNLKDEIKQKNSEIQTLKTASKTDMKNYEILKNQIDALKKNDKASLSNQTERLKSNDKNADELEKRIKELEDEISTSLDKQDKLEDENTNLKNILQTQTKPEVPKKLIFVSQIECNDMQKDTITSLCKNRVSGFLSRYNSNYLYEVIAIVDSRGYGLPYEITSNIKKDEIKRLNHYVDYGVGKERANIAANLIKDEFGEFARISFSPEIVKTENSRGFIIKVYR